MQFGLWFTGKALDLSMEDFDISSIDRELDRERDNDSNSVSSSLSAGLSTSGAFSQSGPIGIPPGTLQQRGSISSLSQSPPSPFGSLPHSGHPLQLHRDAPHDQVRDCVQFFLRCVGASRLIVRAESLVFVFCQGKLAAPARALLPAHGYLHLALCN